MGKFWLPPLPLSFDRTYEGLKLARRGGLGEEPDAFDRTYEGLKLEEVHVLVGQKLQLLTVPMRV